MSGINDSSSRLSVPVFGTLVSYGSWLDNQCTLGMVTSGTPSPSTGQGSGRHMSGQWQHTLPWLKLKVTVLFLLECSAAWKEESLILKNSSFTN